MKKEIKELLLTIVCLMNCSVSNDEVCEVMKLIENYAGSSLPLWQKFSKTSTQEAALKYFRKLLKEL